MAAAAARKLAALHLRGPKADALPACVADGLYLGGAGAARNLKALRKRGITHIVNASPTVPCHFRDNPEGAFEYLALQLFDDPDAGGCWRWAAAGAGPLAAAAGAGRCSGPAHLRPSTAHLQPTPLYPRRPRPLADLLPHIEACNAFIAAARARGAAVLVHCYAGQSRSAALVVAHLMSSRGLGLLDAWALARRARPCAQPNPGFLRQLGDYAQRLQAAAGDELPLERVAAEDSAADLVLTQ